MTNVQGSTPLHSPYRTTAPRRGPAWQLGWMIPAGISLIAGLNAGLMLMGIPALFTFSRLPAVHGMLLVLGFVAALVSLERATALGRWYGYIAPALLGFGGLLLIAAPVPLVVGKCVIAAGAAAFTLVYVPLWRRQYDAALLTQLLGAGLAFAGAVLWIGSSDFTRVVPWLAAFLVLTIGAERVELARITMGDRGGSRLLLHACAITAALIVGLVHEHLGAVLLGAAFVSFVVWLVVHDVARRTIRATGVTRYMAACILAGYVWLAASSVTLLFGSPATPPVYDTVVHGIFLGYTFSMIMAHATTILPAVLKISLPYNRAFWIPAALLQVALIARIGIGNGLGITAAWHLGGYLGVAALLLFLLTAVATAVVTAVRPSAAAPPALGAQLPQHPESQLPGAPSAGAPSAGAPSAGAPSAGAHPLGLQRPTLRGAADSPDPVPRRGFWFMRDIPTALWFIAAIAAVTVHDQIPVARWLIIHLVLLGGVSHAILVWSQYFSAALLRTRTTLRGRRMQNTRLILANLGAATVLIGVPTDLWPVTVAGALALTVAVGWHGTSLFLQARTSMPGRYGKTTRYYMAASALLLVGATLGVLVAGGAGANLVLAHSLVNMLGWVGLTVAGTVVTLWPTILRTRIDERAAAGASRALPFASIGVVASATGAAFTWLPLISAGLALYLAGLLIIAVSLWRVARQAAPYSFSALSVGFALVWWIGTVTVLLVGTLVALVQGDGFMRVSLLMRQVAPFLAAGFAAQIVVGALSYLIPVVIGGGPTPVRTGTTAFDRFGPFRVAVTNAALAALAFPLEGAPRTAMLVLVTVSLASFLPVMVLAMRAQSRSKRERAALPVEQGALRRTGGAQTSGRIVPEGAQPKGRRAAQAVAGLLLVILTIAVCIVAG